MWIETGRASRNRPAVYTFHIFESVRAFIIFFLLFTAAARAQDKIYFLNGEIKEGKVLEINPDDILIESGDKSETILKSDILLLEFRNGRFEQFTPAKQNIVIKPFAGSSARKAPVPAGERLNQISLNTLAFVNADISLFYERIINTKKIGVGAMGALNFNKYVLPYNYSMYPLHNAKKKMDAGVFVNYYPGKLSLRKNLYLGILLKYTSFDYSYVREDTVWNGNNASINITYTPASGYQLATMFIIGTHYTLERQIFIKTMVGLGGFNLKGDYYQQYNFMLNRQAPPGEQRDLSFLPKFYFAFNIGHTF